MGMLHRGVARHLPPIGDRLGTARDTTLAALHATWTSAQPVAARTARVARTTYRAINPILSVLLHLLLSSLRALSAHVGAWADERPRIHQLRMKANSLLERFGLRQRRTKLTAGLVLLALLIGTILTPLATIAAALGDYQQLRALASDGVRHLTNAQVLLFNLAGGASGGTGSGAQNSGDALDGLLQALAPQASSTAQAPYTYVIQRQAGTAYPMNVVVRPAPRMSAAGLGETRFAVTVDKSTPLRFGAPQLPTPPASATPTPTRATGASGTAASRGGQSGSGGARLETLQAVGGELRAAQDAFGQLRARLDGPNWLLAVASALPGMKVNGTAVRALADAGYAIASMGAALCDIALRAMLQAQLASDPAGAVVDITPLTARDLAALQRDVALLAGSLEALQGQLTPGDLGGLPLSQTQRAQLTSVVALLPRLRDVARQAEGWLPALGWMLGVGGPRHFLVQTLDRAELRPSGGFTGDYGVLTIDHGRVSPFELYNINDIEYGYKTNGWIFGKRPPAEYSWWPFANWGLRDSNLSADFPITARIAIALFKNEGQGDVDGVIQFTPTLVAHALRVTGPIYVPGYNETITADNLEDRIHYYQQDPAGIAKQQRLNPDDHTHSLRKRFTQLVTRLLQDKLKQLSPGSLLSLARQVVEDLRSKELQVYATDAHTEEELLKLGIGGAVEAPAKADSFLLVQANVSAAKSTPYVDVTQSDVVTLDDQGGATHRLTITMHNDPRGPIYGYPTYRDYLRIYVPQSARFTGGSGFDEQTPLCYAPPPIPPQGPLEAAANPASTRVSAMPAASPPMSPAATITATPKPAPTKTPIPTPTRPSQFAGLPICAANPYPGGERVCPAAAYAPGGQAYTVLSWGNETVPALDAVGGPTNATSDLPGMAMRGGYVIIPPSCTARVTLRWYVPNVAITAA